MLNSPLVIYFLIHFGLGRAQTIDFCCFLLLIISLLIMAEMKLLFQPLCFGLLREMGLIFAHATSKCVLARFRLRRWAKEFSPYFSRLY